MKWAPKHLRESKLSLEKVQTKPMVIKLFINGTFAIHLTIRLTIAHIGKQLSKYLRGKV
jgi:hypothetical protein